MSKARSKSDLLGTGLLSLAPQMGLVSSYLLALSGALYTIEQVQLLFATNYVPRQKTVDIVLTLHPLLFRQRVLLGSGQEGDEYCAGQSQQGQVGHGCKRD